MKKSIHKNFTMLCEAILLEDSQIINLLKRRDAPQATQLGKAMHLQFKIPSDFGDFEKVSKINFTNLKNHIRYSTHRYWLIFIGTNGSAAVSMRYSSGSQFIYDTIAVDSRGNLNSRVFYTTSDIGPFIKPYIGNIIETYVGRGETVSTSYKNIRGHKLPKKKVSSSIKNKPMFVNVNELFDRLKPAFKKSIVHAIADMKGMVMAQLKNDNFTQANQRINKIEKLVNLYDQLQSGTVNKDVFDRYIYTALATTASHYYPDMTGNINYRPGHSTTVQDKNGINKVLSDIGSGDNEKLATVFYYLKRELLL